MGKKLNTRITQHGYNIKRITVLILVLGMLLTVTGCSGGDSQTMGSRLNTENAVDVDLTLMGSDLIYATVYQMMSKPEEYEGKTIRIEGKYYASYYPITDKYYNYCLIADAAACCSQGLEFELGGDAVYPDDYPADQSHVIVTGVFETYTEEAGQTFYYCRLRDAEYQLISETE